MTKAIATSNGAVLGKNWWNIIILHHSHSQAGEKNVLHLHLTEGMI